MVITALAWNLNAWYGLMVPAQSKKKEILGMEFTRFLLSYVQIPFSVVFDTRGVPRIINGKNIFRLGE